MARILVIDDDAISRLGCEEALELEGHEVVTAADTIEALEAIRVAMLDAVVLEIGPPTDRGLDVVEEILAIERRLPIVLYTTHMGYADDFRSWAADAYIPKSSDTRVLVAAVREVLESARRRESTAVRTKRDGAASYHPHACAHA